MFTINSRNQIEHTKTVVSSRSQNDVTFTKIIWRFDYKSKEDGELFPEIPPETRELHTLYQW